MRHYDAYIDRFYDGYDDFPASYVFDYKPTVIDEILKEKLKKEKKETKSIPMSVIENIKSEILEFAKNPNFGDLSDGASAGAVRCLEIIDKHCGKENTDESKN